MGAALFGGWLAARIAGRKPLENGIALAIILFLLAGAQLLHPSTLQPLA